MLMLRKGKPPAIAVPIGNGAVAYVRPASAFETDLAVAAASRLLAGLVSGHEAAQHARDLLGDEFAAADFTSSTWIDSAAQRVSLLELAVLCCERWEGVVDADGMPVEAPTREWLALLLRVPVVAAAFRDAIQAPFFGTTTEAKP